MAEFTTRLIDMTPSLVLGMCRSFEQKYDLTSDDFYRRYIKGEFVGNHDAVRWAGYWEAYLRSVSLVPVLDKEHGDTPIAAV